MAWCPPLNMPLQSVQVLLYSTCDQGIAVDQNTCSVSSAKTKRCQRDSNETNIAKPYWSYARYSANFRSLLVSSYSSHKAAISALAVLQVKSAELKIVPAGRQCARPPRQRTTRFRREVHVINSHASMKLVNGPARQSLTWRQSQTPAARRRRLLLLLKPFHRRRRLLHGVVVGNRSMSHVTAPAGNPLATLSRDRYFRFRFRLVDNGFNAAQVYIAAVSFGWLTALITSR